MEAGDPSVSLDRLVRGLFAFGGDLERTSSVSRAGGLPVLDRVKADLVGRAMGYAAFDAGYSPCKNRQQLEAAG
jgi:hypothetical protein